MIVRIVIFILFLLEVYNITTYVLYRIKGKGRATLVIRKKSAKGGKMTYCIPGLKADVKETFKFFEQLTLQKPNLMPGGLTYIRYNNYGFDPEQIAKQIIRDIKRFEYEPYIISLSIGDQIARIVEAEIEGLKIIAINPIPNADCIRFDTLFVLQVKLAFLNFLTSFIGWFGELKLIGTNGQARQSISLYLDCLNCQAESNLEVTTEATKGLIISRYDKLLDNKEVVLNFPYLTTNQVERVDTWHANTVIGNVLYAEKMEKLLPNFYPPKEEDA